MADSPDQMPPRRFALDQGFPQPLVKAIAGFFEEQVLLVPVADIDQRLTDCEDWEILLALHHHPEDWDGLVTPEGMHLLSKELSVLMQTKLALVVVQESGHDPVKATGILLSQITGVCNRRQSGVAQLWVLRTIEKRPDEPWEQLRVLAERRKTTAPALYETDALSIDELNTNPFPRPNTD